MADDARRNLVEEVATLPGHAVNVPEKESASAKFDLLFRASDIGLRGPTLEAFKKLDPDTAVEVLQLLVASCRPGFSRSTTLYHSGEAKSKTCKEEEDLPTRVLGELGAAPAGVLGQVAWAWDHTSVR